MAESTSVSVVICAHTRLRRQELLEAVAAVQAQSPPPDEVIVVVDHNAALLAWAEATLQGTRVVANQESRGLSGARNTGVRCADGNLVAFVDDDAVAQDGWLAALITQFEDPNVIGAGGPAIPLWESPRPAWYPEEFLWVIGCSYRGQSGSPGPIRNPIGTNMAFRRAAVRETGGFAPAIGRIGVKPLGAEESEFSIRLAQRYGSGRIVFVPGAVVRHRVTPARTTLRYFVSRCWFEGVSKALVVDTVGAADGLESERSYTLRTLPTGILAGLRDLARGDEQGAARAAAIALGLAGTVAGYVTGRVRRRLGGPAAAAAVPEAPWRPTPDAPRPSVSVVICCYSEERTAQVLDAARSVAQQSVPAQETIIVCDHNPALEADLRAALPDCRVISNDEPQGLSGARNAGARAAEGAVVAFLDDDAVAGDDWLAHLVHPFADSRVAVVGGAVDPIWAAERPGWFPDEFGWVVGYSHRGVPTQTSIVRNPFGGNMAIRLEALRAIGGFRWGIGRVGTRPVGGEETDVCIRLLRMRPDALVVFEPRARIAHHVPEARSTLRYFVARCYHEGISKAQLAAYSGAGRALSEERRYVRHVLPDAVAAGVRSALRGDVADGLGQAGVVIAGVGAAGAGYLRQSVAGELLR